MRKIFGGLAAVAIAFLGLPFAPAGATSTFSFTRLAGTDRYATAAAVATGSFTSVPDVVVATGEAYPDALAGNYAAGGKSSPILLVTSNSVPTVTSNALRSLGASRVTILGQTGAVSSAVQSQLQSAGYTVSRIGGRDRYETARLIAESGGALGVGSIGGAKTAIIATGENFPDAIAAGPAAWLLRLPVLLTTSSSLSGDANTALDDLAIKNVIILGGTTAVSSTVASQIGAKGINVTRIGGTNRFDTAAQFATWELGNGLVTPPTHVNVATGLAFPDALTGGPGAGKEAAPILLSGSVPPETASWLSGHASTLKTGDIFGGTSAVSDSDAAAMAADAGNGSSGSGGSSGSTPAASGTILPLLSTASVLSTNAGVSSTIQFCFTKPVVTLNQALFHVYDASGVGSQKNGDGGATTDGTNNLCQDVIFTTLPTASAAAGQTVATVDIGAVKDVTNNQNPEGNAPMSTSSSFFSANTTSAPDLGSIGSFTANGGNTNVTFNFDSAATNTGGGGYRLVQPDNTLITCAYTSGTGTTAIVTTCPGALTTSNVVRGVVLTGTVSNASAANPQEAYHVGTTATGPQITSAALDLNATSGSTPVDRVTITFNQLVNNPSANTTKFVVFFASAAEQTCAALGCTIIQNPSNGAQVSLDFPDGSLSSAVGVSLLSGAATGFQSALPNQVDAMGMSNSGGTTTSAGFTVGPDLTGVTIVANKDSFGTILGYAASYAFDENLSGIVGGMTGNFRLYDQDGTAIACTSAAVSGTTPTVVVCSAFTGTTDNLKVATVGTVDNGTVVAADSGPSNVEGARSTARSGF